MEQSSDLKAAQVIAITWLSQREYSQKELAEKLQSKGYHTVLIQEVLTQLITQGLQSDARLIEAWIAKRQRQAYGPIRIQQELQQKGVATELIMEKLDFNLEIWQTLLSRIYKQKYGNKIPKTIKERWSQMQMLQRRGFTKPQILQFFSTITNGLLLVDDN